MRLRLNTFTKDIGIIKQHNAILECHKPWSSQTADLKKYSRNVTTILKIIGFDNRTRKNKNLKGRMKHNTIWLSLEGLFLRHNPNCLLNFQSFIRITSGKINMNKFIKLTLASCKLAQHCKQNCIFSHYDTGRHNFNQKRLQDWHWASHLSDTSFNPVFQRLENFWKLTWANLVTAMTKIILLSFK